MSSKMRDILLKGAFAEEHVEIDINGEKMGFVVREMNAGDATKYKTSLFKVVDGKPVMSMDGYQTKLIANCLFDKDGEKIFGDNDLELIKTLPSSVADKIFEVASRINGLEVKK